MSKKNKKNIYERIELDHREIYQTNPATGLKQKIGDIWTSKEGIEPDADGIIKLPEGESEDE